MGQTFRQLLRNLVASFAVKVVVRLVSFVVKILLVNYLGRTQNGVYVKIMAYVFALLAFIDLGWSSVVIREIGRRPSEAARHLANYFALETFSSLLFAALLTGLFWAGGFPPEQRLLAAVAAAGLIFAGLARAPADALVARQRVDAAAMVELGANLASSLAIFVAIRLRAPLPVFFWIYVGYAAALFAGASATARRVIGPFGWRIEPALWRQLFRQGFLCLIIAGAFALQMSLDVLTLSRMVPDEQLGLYGAAANLINPLLLFMESSMLAVYPVLAAKHEADPAGFRFLLDKALKGMLAIGLPMALGIALLSRDIIGVLLPQFGPSAAILALLVWRLPLLYVIAPIAHALLAGGRFRLLAAVQASGAALNVALNLAFIPRWGILGAAAGSVLTQAALLAYWIAIRGRIGRFRVEPLDAARLGLALAAMALVVGLWGWRAGTAGSVVGLLARIAVGAAVYGATLLAAGFVSRDEWRRLKQEWAGR
ncbi:MAG: flippase [Candidatus Sumerlaeota bacterium]|nr:flippase [Candidatus Sumerlaeota bacterium]